MNLAGPYIYTCDSFIRACLEAGVHYLDLCNEVYALQSIFSYNPAVEKRGIAVIPDVGFNTITSDCLAKHISYRIKDPLKIETCIDALKKPSAGTIKGGVNVFAKGGLIIRNGKLLGITLGEGCRKIFLQNRIIYATPTPMGDLLTIFRSTGVPDITVSIPAHPLVSDVIKFISPVFMPIAASRPGRDTIFYLADKFMKGPDEISFRTDRAFV